jgi:glycosyltransferase involved in cell wall biosynthesis
MQLLYITNNQSLQVTMSYQQKNKKKILYIITKSTPFGGAQRYVLELALHAKSHGHEVLVALGGEGELHERLVKNNIKVHSIKSLEKNIHGLKDLLVFINIFSLLLKEKPDVVHLNSSKVGLLGAIASRLRNFTRVIGRIPRTKYFIHNTRIVFTAHGWAFTEDRHPFSKFILQYFQWFTVLLSHTTIAVSHGTKKEIGHMPLMENKIVVIHNGISPPKLLPKNLARKKLAPLIPHEGTLWIGVIAELHKNKGLEYGIDAFARLTKNHPEARLVIVGDGEEREILSWIISRYKIEDRVTLAGYHTNASSYLGAFDIFLLPSIKEGFPYTILEAGAAGLPVVASRVGGIPEIIRHGNTDLLVEPKNIDNIESVLEKLIVSKDMRTQQGEKIKHHVQTNFSNTQMRQKTMAIYC